MASLSAESTVLRRKVEKRPQCRGIKIEYVQSILSAESRRLGILFWRGDLEDKHKQFLVHKAGFPLVQGRVTYWT
ncbi:hypothetical protein Elgi_72660 [Paenibacillus elgii]|nr:hypothetical protein Elgi_72660 [Paenibacillus elgii]